MWFALTKHFNICFLPLPLPLPQGQNGQNSNKTKVYGSFSFIIKKFYLSKMK
jgi:hypothetical protein